MSRPVPNPGILDIAPYTPGKSPVPEPGRKVFKLSANETPFGPSPKAIEAYKQAAAHLEDYPEGTSRVLREAIGRAFGLDPDRIICGAGSDEILNLLAHTYLGHGDEAISTTHGFLVYPIATMANGAINVVAPETNFTADVDAILKLVSPRTKLVWLANPNNPTGTYLPFDEVKRLRAGLPPHVLLVLDAAYSDYVSRNDYELGIELVATTDNTVMTHTFSKIHGLAALRIGWMFGPANIVDAVNRIRGPFNVSTPAMLAAVAAIEDTAHQQMSKAHTEKWRNWLTEEIDKARPQGDAERGEFRPDPFPAREGQDLGRGRRVPDQARPGAARAEQLRPAARAAHDHRHRGGQSPGGRRLARLHGAQVSAAPLFKKIALIGFGLIGGSIARAARAQGLAGEIVTTARSAKTRARVQELGIVDRVVETNAEAVKDADLVILCIPVGACGPVAQEIAAHLKPGAIVSDVGSVKGAVVRDMAPHLPAGVHFVPAHPVAGTEHSGPDSGFAELFINRWCILTPPEGTDPNAVERLRAFWAALGARVEIMTPDHHDLVLAITSHLPHLIAYTIVGTADELAQVTSSEVMKFSAGGFRDFTRIAASDPTMWRDVFLANKDAVLEMLGTFNEDLSKLTRAIRRGDGEALFEHFTRTRAIRRGIVEIGQDSAAPDFGRPHAQLGKKAE